MAVSKIQIKNLQGEKLDELSKKMLLSLQREEMVKIKEYFKSIDREPTRMELEIIAQTWSEHCKHKTMTGFIEFEEIWEETGKKKKETINNLLKNTVFKATKELNRQYCWSVFEDNAGVIRFDKKDGIAMKVETHNHPSAIEPYGGASTGVGGVIRDILGCGRASKPVLNIDVFCFGPQDLSHKNVPDEILHPKRIFKGVVKGVRDYSNRMGIPTSSGAILFDRNYLYNPLVFCGTIGIIPKKYVTKKVMPGDKILAVGGRTGRDGLHGATFSSDGLTEEVDVGCVQIGDPITEKKFADVLIKMRDMNLYNSITDCGAGGFSSAIGEMGQETGARVYLERAPLKYRGLKPWEIFLSESQERMVLSVPKKNIDKVREVLKSEDVESTVLGEFTDTKRLEVFFNGEVKADLDMKFIHEEYPRIKRKAVRVNPKQLPMKIKTDKKIEELIKKVLSHPNVASKEVVIRQYDHEVQGGSVVKPLTGDLQELPQDGCVTRPLLERKTGIGVGLGINPNYGKYDPYKMAMSNCEEAARNFVACGGCLSEAAFMDNFCWGDVSDEKILGNLVKASQGCYRASRSLGVPFTSGKDSLNNYYNTKENKSVNIPGTLLITCVGPVKDIGKTAQSGFRKSGNSIYLCGKTFPELKGSIVQEYIQIKGGEVPDLREKLSKSVLNFVRDAIKSGLAKGCHDLSEGGLASGICEMCFSGVGAEIDLKSVITENGKKELKQENIIKLFSESNSRFLIEVEQEKEEEFNRATKNVPVSKIGKTIDNNKLIIKDDSKKIAELDIENLRKIFKQTIKW